MSKTEVIIKEIPEWIKAEIFEDIIKEKYPNFRNIIDFKVKSAVGSGENYLTVIFRIELKIQVNDDEKLEEVLEKFILKVPFSCLNDTVNEYHDLFVVETDFYDRVTPEMEQIYKKYGQTVKFRARHFKFTNPPPCDYILLEDLVNSGYTNINRQQGMDLQQTKMVLEKLAQWHAVTAKYKELNGDYSVTFNESYFKEREVINSMNIAFNRAFNDCMHLYELTEQQQIHIKNYMPKLTDLYTEFADINQDAFNVLNHGDIWINNFMFLTNESLNNDSTAPKVLFIDYQLPKYGTPAMDLLSLLMTSPNMDIKLNYFDDFIKYYYSNLIKYLKLLKYELTMPTLEELKKSLTSNGIWAFVSAQRILPIALLQPSSMCNIDNFVSLKAEGLVFKTHLLSNPLYVKQMKEILPWLIERNFLNIDIKNE